MFFVVPNLDNISPRARLKSAARGIGSTMELAQEVSLLMRNLRWDLEGDLARIVGDIPAHRVVAGLRAFSRATRDAGWRGAQSAAEYATEEAALVASHVKVATFVERVQMEMRIRSLLLAAGA